MHDDAMRWRSINTPFPGFLQVRAAFSDGMILESKISGALAESTGQSRFDWLG
jgi:hypothetical protein